MQTSRRKGPELLKDFAAQLPRVLPEAYSASNEATRAKLMRLLGIHLLLLYSLQPMLNRLHELL